LVTGGSDGGVRLWNFSSGELLHMVSHAPPSDAMDPTLDVTALLHVEVISLSLYLSIYLSI